MKTVFVQQGVSNVGKTTTIRALYNMLVAEHPDAQVSDLDPGSEPQLGKTETRAVVRIGDFLIGLESAGDPAVREARLAKSLSAFATLGCDAIVCAARTFGGTVDVVLRLEADGYEIVWRERKRKQAKEEQAEANTAEARWMFDQIQEMLSATAV